MNFCFWLSSSSSYNSYSFFSLAFYSFIFFNSSFLYCASFFSLRIVAGFFILFKFNLIFYLSGDILHNLSSSLLSVGSIMILLVKFVFFSIFRIASSVEGHVNLFKSIHVDIFFRNILGFGVSLSRISFSV